MHFLIWDKSVRNSRLDFKPTGDNLTLWNLGFCQVPWTWFHLGPCFFWPKHKLWLQYCLRHAILCLHRVCLLACALNKSANLASTFYELLHTDHLKQSLFSCCYNFHVQLIYLRRKYSTWCVLRTSDNKLCHWTGVLGHVISVSPSKQVSFNE